MKLVTDGVEALDLKDAHAQQLCTRAVGQIVERESVLSVPDNPLINVSASTSRTETYVDGSTHGVRGTSTIGDVTIGGTVGPLTTPRLVIKGLQTTANAFNTPQGYGHDEAFTFASISLELLDNTLVTSLPPELQQLLAPLDQVTDTVFTGTQATAQQVFQVLSDVTKPIEIPAWAASPWATRTAGPTPTTPSRRPRRCASRSPPGSVASSSSSGPPASGWAGPRPSASSAPAARRWTTRSSTAR